MAVVAVQPHTVVIVFQVEHLEVAVRIGHVQSTFRTTTPQIISGLNIITHHNAIVLCTKYLHFLFEVSTQTLRLNP